MNTLLVGYEHPGLICGLEARGHQVFYGEQTNWYARCWGNLQHVPKMTPREFGPYLRGLVNHHAIDAVVFSKCFDTNFRLPLGEDPDFWHIPATDIKAIHDSGVVTMYASFDDPDACARWTQTGMHPHMDAIGTCADDTIEFYKRWSPDAEVWRYWPAFDTVRYASHSPPTDDDRSVDFVLVASPYLAPNPGFGLPRRDIVRAALEVGAKVRIYGPDGWLRDGEGGDPAFAEIYRGSASLERLPAIFGGAKVSYSSWLWQSRGYWTDRPSIIAGSGGFNLCESQIGMGATFEHGVYLAYHGHKDIEDFKKQLTWWLAHDAERRACAERMRVKVLAEHTYENRAAEIDGVLRRAAKRRAMRPRGCCR